MPTLTCMKPSRLPRRTCSAEATAIPMPAHCQYPLVTVQARTAHSGPGETEVRTSLPQNLQHNGKGTPRPGPVCDALKSNFAQTVLPSIAYGGARDRKCRPGSSSRRVARGVGRRGPQSRRRTRGGELSHRTGRASAAGPPLVLSHRPAPAAQVLVFAGPRSSGSDSKGSAKTPRDRCVRRTGSKIVSRFRSARASNQAGAAADQPASAGAEKTGRRRRASKTAP